MQLEAFAVPGCSWSEAQLAAKFAESAGFDGISVPEITGDPFSNLTAMALATERIHLRTGILVAFPRSPMVVAGSAWALQQGSAGRFGLGLGTQVKGHNERRFSVPWSPPSPRLQEFVEALRAIWRCWQLGEKLDFQGKHYQFTLMTPEFSPPAMELPPIPIQTAAVRPAMMRLAGRVSDGVRLHGFATRAYLEQVAVPALEKGLAQRGRNRGELEVCGGGFICTGATMDDARKMSEWARYRVAFYGSTRTYWSVFEVHGWDELGAELHQMSKQGRWEEMAALIPDEVLHHFAVVAPFDALAPAIEARFGGISDRVELPLQPHWQPGAIREVMQDIRRIPIQYDGPRKQW